MWKCIVWKVGFAKKFFQENFVVKQHLLGIYIINVYFMEKIDSRLYFKPSYSDGRHADWKMVGSSSVQDYEWSIYSNGIWPCIYVTLPEKHPLNNLTQTDSLSGFIDGPNEITYWEDGTVGWDFGHFTDYRHDGKTSMEGKKVQTVESLKQYLSDIIQQCQEIANNPEIIEQIENTDERGSLVDMNSYYDDEYDYDDYDDYDEDNFNESKNIAGKNMIRLSENELKSLISESVKKILLEDVMLRNKAGETASESLGRILPFDIYQAIRHAYRELGTALECANGVDESALRELSNALDMQFKQLKNRILEIIEDTFRNDGPYEITYKRR